LSPQAPRGQADEQAKNCNYVASHESPLISTII
jgi:hypothetical protein